MQSEQRDGAERSAADARMREREPPSASIRSRSAASDSGAMLKTPRSSEHPFLRSIRSQSFPDLVVLAAEAPATPNLSTLSAEPGAMAAARGGGGSTGGTGGTTTSSGASSGVGLNTARPDVLQRLSESAAIRHSSPAGATTGHPGGGNVPSTAASSVASERSGRGQGGGGGGCRTTAVGWLDEELVALARRMQAGIDVKDRHYRLKKYKCCFVGREAVTWMLQTARVAAIEDDAVALGNAMMQLGLLAHVTFEHPFENRTLFYRFHGTGEDAEGLAPGGDGTSWCDTLGLRSTETGDDWSLEKEVTRLQRRVAGLSAELELQKAVDSLLHERSAATEARQKAVARRLLQVEAALQQQPPAPPPQPPRSIGGTQLALQISILLLLLVLTFTPRVLSVKALLTLAAVAVTCPLVFVWRHSAHPKMPPAPERDSPQRRPSELQLSTDGTRAQWQPQRPPQLARDSAREDFPDGTSEDLDPPGYDSDTTADNASVINEPVQRQHTQPSPSAPTPPPDEALFRGWQDAPNLLRLKPVPGQRLHAPHDPARIPLNGSTPIAFESDLFSGKVAMWVKGIPSAPAGLFKGKRRRTRITVQGRFKRPLAFDEVITGQEFCRVKDLPARWLVDSVLIKLARAISPSVEIGPLDTPSVLIPVCAIAQGIEVSRPGEEPDMMGEETEDMRLCGPLLEDKSGKPLSAAQRKRFFLNADNRRQFTFDTDNVYTFHIFQHLVDCSTYELDLAVYRFDLTHYLDGQPLQFMVRTRGGGGGGSSGGQPVFAFELWHEKLLPAARAAAGAKP